ncbi:MAG: peptidyl-prolyl cis-trans isomerase [candidate division WOR-3 bacterium]
MILFLFFAFDGIACVVDREVITREELRYISVFYPGISSQVLLEKLINDKIILRIAEADTLKVSDEEIAKMKDEMLLNNPSLSFILRDEYLDKVYTEQLKAQAYSNKLVSSKFREKLKISPGEVHNFYNTYKDSLRMPETVVFQRLQIPVLSPENDIFLKKAKRILDEYIKGMDFSLLVKKYSDDFATVPYGGRIGSFTPQDIPIYFAQVLKLEEGEAEIFESPRGYHIIRLEGKDGINLILSQILVEVKLKEEEIRRREREALKIKEKWEKGDTTFPYEIESMGPIPLKALTPELFSIIDALKPGEVSKPILEGSKFYLFKIVKKEESKVPEFSEIKDKLTSLLIQKKMLKLLSKIIEEEKKHVFVKKL